MWFRPSQEPWHWHHSAAPQSTVDPAPGSGRTGGSSLSGPGSLQSDRADWREEHKQRGPAQPKALVQMGPAQPQCTATTGSRLFGEPAVTLCNRKKSATATGRRTGAPGRSRAWHAQPRHGRAPAKLRLRDAELAPPSD